jgi:exopolyphosphatase/guanosine-5'-triphosphate,3'-diphosphate pyrophosphatase
VPVAVIDVGSNTVRLHVSRDGSLLYKEKAMLRLGEAIERFGTIPETKLAETGNCVARFVLQARRLGVERIEVLVTSPGRQAENGEALLDRLAASAGVPVRLLSSVEEGRLGFVGAASATRGPSGRLIAVCDVGGGSAQIAVGTRRDGPAWVRSIDIGSMRLTSRLLNDDPPGDVAVQAARAEVDRLLEGVVPPLPQSAFAVGGSARALRSILGVKLGTEELHEATLILGRTPGREIVDIYGIDRQRVATLAAGAVILEAICERLGGPPLRVVRGGVREGAADELASTLAAA